MASQIVNEEQFQAACAQWYHNEYRNDPKKLKLLVTVDNNVSKRVLNPYQRMIEGSRKKALGIIPGASDMYFVNYGSVDFIELKLWNGVQSADQKIFQQAVEERGHRYHLVYCHETGDQLTYFKILIKWLMSQQTSTGK